MVFSDALADRIRAEFSRRAVDVRQQRMFGGLCFMVCDKMCVCILAEHLMVRLDPEDCDWALTQPGCRPMDLTGRPMKGFVLVEMDALDTQSQLEKWLDLALAYNPKAKLSKKRRATEDL